MISATGSTTSATCSPRSPILVEMYLAAAESVIDAAFRIARGPGSDHEPARRCGPAGVPEVHAAGPHAARGQEPPDRPTAVEDPELKRQQRIYDILRGFADRAFRRPATHDELTRLLEIVLSAEKDGEEPEAALRLALQAVLASPQFLFRVEQDPAATRPTAPCRTTISTWPRGSPISSGAACPTTSCSDWPPRERSVAGTTFAAQVARMLRDPRGAGARREFRRPVAPDAASSGEFAPDPVALPRVRRIAPLGDARGDAALLPVDPGRGPQRARLPRRRLHVRQRAPGPALRHPRRRRATSFAGSRWPARRGAAS